MIIIGYIENDNTETATSEYGSMSEAETAMSALRTAQSSNTDIVSFFYASGELDVKYWILSYVDP